MSLTSADCGAVDAMWRVWTEEGGANAVELCVWDGVCAAGSVVPCDECNVVGVEQRVREGECGASDAELGVRCGRSDAALAMLWV